MSSNRKNKTKQGAALSQQKKKPFTRNTACFFSLSYGHKLSEDSKGMWLQVLGPRSEEQQQTAKPAVAPQFDNMQTLQNILTFTFDHIH